MENASKALIMAAEVLIGVMIISIGVYIFHIFAEYSAQRYKEMEDVQIAEFNTQFLKFYGTKKDSNGKSVPKECRIHDIMGIANLAQKNNLENYLIETVKQGNKTGFQIKTGVNITNSIYVQVDLGNIKNLELKSNADLVKLIKENDLTESVTGEKSDIKYYWCKEYTLGSTGRVNYIKFVELP